MRLFRGRVMLGGSCRLLFLPLPPTPGIVPAWRSDIISKDMLSPTSDPDPWHWCGSGSGDPCRWIWWILIRIRILLFSSLNYKMPTKKYLLKKVFLLIIFWRCIYIIIQRQKHLDPVDQEDLLNTNICTAGPLGGNKKKPEASFKILFTISGFYTHECLSSVSVKPMDWLTMKKPKQMCRLKKLTCKGILRQVFDCISSL